MKGSFIIYFVLVTLLYYANCSKAVGQECTRNGDQSGTGDNGDLTSQTEKTDKIKEVLKNCTIKATEITKYLDSCFHDFGDCILDLDCLKNRTCIESKSCDLSEEKLKTRVSTTVVWQNIDTLFDICNLNATKLSIEMKQCIEAQICLTDQEMKALYQNISHYMCNISNGFYNLSGEILKQIFPPQNQKQGEQHNKQCKKETGSSDKKSKGGDKKSKGGDKKSKGGDKKSKGDGKQDKKNAKKTENTEDKSIKDCRINATSVCEKMEKCITGDHGVLPPLTDCDIDAGQLVNKSMECVEKIKCLTRFDYTVWVTNNSVHMIRIGEGFGYLSMAFWKISQEYKPTEITETDTNGWKCQPIVEPEPTDTAKQTTTEPTSKTKTTANVGAKTTPNINDFMAQLFGSATTPTSENEA